MSESDELIINRAMAILNELPDKVRHPIVIDYNDDITVLATSLALVCATHGIEGLIGTLRTTCEVLFVLGYRAGQRAAQEPSLDLWRDALDDATGGGAGAGG